MINELRSVKAHIDHVREMMRKYSDDSYMDLSDLSIYKLLVDARALFLSRRIKKGETTSELNKIPICVPLEKTKYFDCSCIPKGLDCYVLKSKFKIPNMFMRGNKAIMDVTTIDGSMHFGKINPMRLKQENGASRVPNRIGYQLFDGYLYVFGTTDLPLVIVNALWVDPADLADITDCVNTSGEPCFDVFNSEFPIEPDLNTYIYEYIEDRLARREGKIVDAVNNSNSPAPNNEV
jgi:hypothetical protein